METTTPSNHGRSITYFGIAYTFTREDNDRLSSIDNTVRKRLKNVIYPAPKGSRHITIMNLTHVAEGYKDRDTMRFFEENGGLYKTRLRRIAGQFAPFKVKFTHFQASAGAIVLRGQDQGQIAAMRDKLIDLPRLSGRIIDAGFIHSTQARYRKHVAISKVHKQMEDINVNTFVMIDKIGLVRADVSFSEPHVVLEEYELTGKAKLNDRLQSSLL